MFLVFNICSLWLIVILICHVMVNLHVPPYTSTFGQLLERKWLLFGVLLLGLFRQKALLLRHCSELCVFTLTLFLALLWQRLWQEPEGNTREQDDCASHNETQPPGTDPTGVLVVNGHSV